MPVYYSPLGNPEIWDGHPGNEYLSEEEWDALHPIFRPRPASLHEALKRATGHIDTVTSTVILAGFEHEADPGTGAPEHLHFSYDAFDQQNFADSAIAMQLGAAAGGESGIPATTPWNAYRNWTPESGGELVVLQLTAETFLPLYAAALNHKAACMAEGSARKAAVARAESMEAIQTLLEEWGI